MKYNQSSVQTPNEALLLKYIINNKEISRSELANLTNLSKASVSEIISRLIKNSLIYESHEGESSQAGGRRPIYLKFNPNAGSVVSINIGIDRIYSMMTTLNGEIIHKEQTDKNTFNSTIIINQLTSIIDSYLARQPETPYGVVGIAIAIHGIVLNNIIQFTPNYSLDKVPLYEELSKHYEIPVYIENEANLGALGEYVFSNPYNNSLVNINIHHGVGAGIIEYGEIQVGERGYIGEMGHSILFPDGRSCPCGNKGCLEQYISNEVILTQISKEKNEELTIDSLLAYANRNDKVTMDILKETAKYLSIGINNLICFYDPDIVIINSRIYNQLPQLINLVSENLTNYVSINTLIKGTKLNGNSTLYGCTALVLQKFLKIDKIKFN